MKLNYYYAATVLLAAFSSGTASGEMKTFEQQVSVAQGKNTRVAGHAESKSSNTELPECSTLGIAKSTEGCTTYCTDKNLGSSSYGYGIIGDGTVTCSCTLDDTTTNVCIWSPPGPNTEGKPCTDFGITDWKTCRDYLPASTLTKIGDNEIVSCTCGSIDGVTTEPFSCTATTSSSSALSLLLSGAFVTVTTYLIAMVI